MCVPSCWCSRPLRLRCNVQFERADESLRRAVIGADFEVCVCVCFGSPRSSIQYPIIRLCADTPVHTHNTHTHSLSLYLSLSLPLSLIPLSPVSESVFCAHARHCPGTEQRSRCIACVQWRPNRRMRPATDTGTSCHVSPCRHMLCFWSVAW